jgi:hypothetical protein
MKKSTLIKIILAISLLLTIYGACFLVINKIIKPEIHESARLPTRPYYTDIFPDHEPLWLDNTAAAYIAEHRLKIFDSEDRTEINIPNQIKNLQIKTLILDDEHIFLITQESIIDINNDFDIIEEIKLPKGNPHNIKINYPYVCLTEQLNKTSPDGIGSITTIYNINNQPQENNQNSIELSKEEYKGEFKHSIKPLHCDPDKAFLTTAFPQLMQKAFLWSPSSQNSISEIKLPDSSPIYRVEISPNNQTAFIQNIQKEIFMVNIKNGSVTKLNQSSPTLTWAPGDKETIFALHQTNNQREILKVSNTTRKIVYKYDAPVQFEEIIPSPNQKNFILISQNGEIWILKLEE